MAGSYKSKYTGEEIDAAIGGVAIVEENLESGLAEINGKLADYSTTTEMESIIERTVGSIDLSVYAKTETLAKYVTTDSVNTKLADYATTDSVNTKLADYATTESVENTLADYATTESVDTTLSEFHDEIGGSLSDLNEAIAACVTNDALNGALASYSTTEEMNSAIQIAKDSIDLSVYAKTETLAEYATNESVSNQLKSYSTTEEMNSAIQMSKDSIDLSVYAKTETLASYAKTEALDSYAKRSTLANYATTASVNAALNSYATTDSVDDKLANYSTLEELASRLESYSTTEEMNSAIQIAKDSIDLSVYAKTSTLANYATTSSVNSALANYTKTSDLNTRLQSYATTSAMNTALSAKADNITLSAYAKTETLASYATTSSVDSKLTNYYTREETNSAIQIAKDSIDLSVSASVTNAINMGKNLATNAKLNVNNHFRMINNSSCISRRGYVSASGNPVIGQSGHLGLEKGVTYTISFTTWRNSADTISLSWDLYVPPEIGDENVLPQNTFDVGHNPTRYAWTVTLSHDFAPAAMLRFLNFGLNGVVHPESIQAYISDIQIERGTEATAWTPALEDIASSYAADAKYATHQYVDGKLALEILTADDGSYYSQLSANVGKIKFEAGQIEIDTDNFKLNPDGSVYVSGDVVASSLATPMTNGKFSSYTIASQMYTTNGYLETKSKASDGSSYYTWYSQVKSHVGPTLGVYEYNANNSMTAQGELYISNHKTVLYALSGQLSGTWYDTSGTVAVTSWRGAKHDIENLSDKYSVLFDNLKPTRFKYNNGQSDRYHMGLILDELKDAMDIAGLDSSEVAAYCVDDEDTGDGGIRYTELVTLNIYELQKLKRRVQELEELLLINKAS